MDYRIAGHPLLQTLFTDTHTLIFTLGIDGKIVDANDCFSQKTGFSIVEIKQKYIWELLMEPDQTLLKLFADKSSYSSYSFSFTHEWIHKRQAPLQVQWSASLFIDEHQDTPVFICIGKDVSVYKRMESSLKIKEHKLEQLQRISKIGYWEHNLVENTVIISSQTAEIYGFPYSQEPLPANSRFNLLQKPYGLDAIYNLVIDAEKDEFMARLQQIMEARQPFQWTYTVEVNGKIKRIYAEGEFIFDDTGKVVRVAGITQDITQKFEFEQNLKYKEKLLDTISEAIISTDTEFTITSWNKGAQQIYGYTASEAIGKKVGTLLKTEFPEGASYWDAVKEVNDKGTWFNRVVQTHKNSQKISIMANSSKVLDEKNRHIGFVGVNRDITELVKIEKKLLDNQANLLAVLENTPDSIYLVDTQFRIMLLNTHCQQNFYKRFGVTLLNGDLILEKLPASIAGSVNLTLQKALSGQQLHFEATYTDQEGKEQIIESVVNPIKDGHSQVQGIVVYTRNITERKKIQEEILSLRVESEKMRASALLEGQEIERKRLLKELHDGIGQMLQVIKLKVDTLQDEFPQIRASLEDTALLVAQTISDVNALIYDLMPYNLENLGLEGAIRALIEQYQYNTKLHLHCQLWFNLTTARFEKTLQIYIYRILQECLNNIAKHARATHVTVQLTQLADGLLLMVEDDGIGFNLEEKLKQYPGSSGLKNLLERCKLIHADIDIDTMPGHGCTINIIFPL